MTIVRRAAGTVVGKSAPWSSNPSVSSIGHPVAHPLIYVAIVVKLRSGQCALGHAAGQDWKRRNPVSLIGQ